MEFKEYARKRFEKENEGNGLSMDKDYPDGLRDKIMGRLDIIFYENFCIGLMRYIIWRMKHIEKRKDVRSDSAEQLEDECRKKRQEIEELKEAYRTTDEKNDSLKEDIEMEEYRLGLSLKRREGIIKSINDYPGGKVRLFTNITTDEMNLFDYILDIISVSNQNDNRRDRFSAAKNGLWEEYSVDERIKLLELLEKAVDSDGDLWVTEKCWKATCYKIMCPVQYRLKQNLEEIYELVNTQQMNSYQDAGWLLELDRKIVKIKKKYIANNQTEGVEEELYEQIEKYMNEK